MENERPTTVLLTGASSGIGLEIARLLTARGCEVWGASRDTARLPQLPHFHPVCMDLAADASIRESFAQAQRDAGGFDVLINNAGSAVFGPTATVPAELAREQFQLLLHGPLELIRLAVPAMRQRGHGVIINITSLAGSFAVPYMAAYSAAKAALSAYSRCLRLELAESPVRVVDVQPADINTPFHAATRRFAPDEDRARQEAVWEVQRREMAAAPPPSCVAETVWRVMNSPNPPPVVTVGSFYQAKIGPFMARVLPMRWLERLMRRFFGI
ncbi:MAG: SDR family NAD(P)-dependent oxidoreductase [Verrucomicrobia bacterium]|nr:SDR family NAD(P)-dependent oxidoreductase [Verrucomicrobiota bacterium]